MFENKSFNMMGKNELSENTNVKSDNVPTKRESKQKGSYIDKALFYSILAFGFLFPLIIMPIFGSFVIAAKLAFLIIFIVWMIVLILFKLVVEKKFNFKLNKFDIPFFIFLLVMALSFGFSTSKAVSGLGNYGSFYPSLIVFIAAGVVYLIIRTQLITRRQLESVKVALLFGVAFATLIGLLNFFGVYILQLDITKNRNVFLIGSAPVTALLDSVFLLYLLFRLGREKKPVLSVLWVVLTVILAMGAFFLGNILSGTVVILGGLLMVFYGVLKKKPQLFVAVGAIFLLAIVSFLPIVKDINEDDGFLTHPALDQRNSWAVTASTIRDYPFLGSGLGTFSNDSTRYKSTSYNAGQYTEFRYNFPASDYLLFITEAGIVGFIAYLLVFGNVIAKFKFVERVVQADDKRDIKLVSTYVMLLGLMIGYLFVSSNLVAFVIFIFLLAIFGKELVLAETLSDELYEDDFRMNPSGSSFDIDTLLKYSVFVVFILSAIGGSIYLYKLSSGEYYYYKGDKALGESNLLDAYSNYGKAINSNGLYDMYRRKYLITSVAIANFITQDENGELKKELTQDEQTQITTLFAQAEREANNAISLNTLNSLNHEAKGDVYNALVGLYATDLGKDVEPTQAGNTGQATISAYTNAEQLDPYNLAIKMKLGSVYNIFGQYNQAANYFLGAVNINNGYANGYYNLSHALSSLNDYTNAVTAMEYVVKLVPEDSDDYKKAQSELQDLKAKAEQAKAVDENSDTGITEEDIPPSSDTESTDEPLTDTQGQQ